MGYGGLKLGSIFARPCFLDFSIQPDGPAGAIIFDWGSF